MSGTSERTVDILAFIGSGILIGASISLWSPYTALALGLIVTWSVFVIGLWTRHLSLRADRGDV